MRRCERGAAVVRACRSIYREPGCASAWRALLETGGPDADLAVIRGCAAAYCPVLSEPRPALCKLAEADPGAWRARWPELNRAILVHELGEPLAGRPAELTGAIFGERPPTSSAGR